MRARALAIPIVLFAATAHADDAKRGEACRARSDCSADLRCLRAICVDEPTFEQQRPVERQPQLSRTYTYAGGAAGAVLPALGSSAGEGASFALRLGRVIDQLQLQLELSPATTALANVTPSVMTQLDLVGSIAWLPRISDMVSWVVRFGGGGGLLLCQSCDGTTNSVGSFGFGELRADVFGVQVRTSAHLMVELAAPSFRVLLLTQNPGVLGNVLWEWVTAVGVNYVF